MQAVEVKAGKNEFKCFNCRSVFLKKDGDWFDWDQMQVHLCRPCDKNTKKDPQRCHGN